VRFAGEDITSLPSPQRARRGLARSFQITSIYPDFSALENVMLAVQARAGLELPLLAPGARGERAALARSKRSLEEDRAGRALRCGRRRNLAHGEQRALEIRDGARRDGRG